MLRPSAGRSGLTGLAFALRSDQPHEVTIFSGVAVGDLRTPFWCFCRTSGFCPSRKYPCTSAAANLDDRWSAVWCPGGSLVADRTDVLGSRVDSSRLSGSEVCEELGGCQDRPTALAHRLCSVLIVSPRCVSRSQQLRSWWGEEHT